MLPKDRAIEIPLIKEIARRGGRCRPSDHEGGKTVFAMLADFFELTTEDLVAVNESDGRSKWENMVRFTRNNLLKFDIVNNYEHGVWGLTDKGKEVADFVEEVSFTPDSLAPLASSGGLATRKDIYDNMISAGVDKVKALEIVEANDCRSILEILGKS